jgi:WD40 repeat protein
MTTMRQTSATTGQVRIWDPSSGQPIGQPLPGHHGGVNAVTLGRARNRNIIVSADEDKTVRI